MPISEEEYKRRLNSYQHIDLTLSVRLIFKPNDVYGMEDMLGRESPESYLTDRLASFVENEIDNCSEYPAKAVVDLVQDTQEESSNG